MCEQAGQIAHDFRPAFQKAVAQGDYVLSNSLSFRLTSLVYLMLLREPTGQLADDARQLASTSDYINDGYVSGSTAADMLTALTSIESDCQQLGLPF